MMEYFLVFNYDKNLIDLRYIWCAYDLNIDVVISILYIHTRITNPTIETRAIFQELFPHHIETWDEDMMPIQRGEWVHYDGNISA